MVRYCGLLKCPTGIDKIIWSIFGTHSNIVWLYNVSNKDICIYCIHLIKVYSHYSGAGFGPGNGEIMFVKYNFYNSI